MPMSEEDRLLVHAYLDEELDLADALALEKRIASEPRDDSEVRTFAE